MENQERLNKNRKLENLKFNALEGKITNTYELEKESNHRLFLTSYPIIFPEALRKTLRKLHNLIYYYYN